MYILINDFQHISSDGKIELLKTNTKIQERDGNFYLIKINRKTLRLNKEIVENTPNYFKKVDLRTSIQDILKKNNKSKSPKLSQLIVEYLDNDYFHGKELIEDDVVKVMLDACRLMFKETEDEKWIEPIDHMIDKGWLVDAKGISKQ